MTLQNQEQFNSGVSSQQTVKICGPTKLRLFESVAWGIEFSGSLDKFNSWPGTELIDAYDSNRDGRYLRLYAELSHPSGTRQQIPIFPLKTSPNSPWSFQLRWNPRKSGSWRFVIRGSIGYSATEIEDVNVVLQPLLVSKDVAGFGPLVKGSDKSNFLLQLNADQSKTPLWLMGIARAWLAPSGPGGSWFPHDNFDREEDLLVPMRRHGFNLLNQWMAPWEYMLVHHDCAEYWRTENNQWHRIALTEESAKHWRSFGYIDQGRAAAFDRWLELCDGDQSSPPIYLLLSVISHQGFQLREHPWGGQESGWSPENDRGRQGKERLNGFSGFMPNMEVWQFFQARPDAPISDWRCQLFDAQANFFRYVIARWSHFRSLGLWVLMDELDAVGDCVGEIETKTGWWGHPECDHWLKTMIEMFRGQLKRIDGTAYQGDSYDHPIHAATTSHAGQFSARSNISWPRTNSPLNQAKHRLDVKGWHWYPELDSQESRADELLWTIDGVLAYGEKHSGPRLCSEFGLPERYSPEVSPTQLYPALYHHAFWAAIFSGHAGPPIDWNDGKEFGEAWPKQENLQGNASHAFTADRYPIDLSMTLDGFQRFWRQQADSIYGLEEIKFLGQLQSGKSQRTLALQTADHQWRLWCFAGHQANDVELQVSSRGHYRVQFYDPLSGNAIPELVFDKQTQDHKASLTIPLSEAFQSIRKPVESSINERFDLAVIVERHSSH